METIIDKDFFEVTWGDGYPVTPKRGIALEDLISSEKWELDSKFISRLEQTEIGDRLRYTDPSGEVFFERITLNMLKKKAMVMTFSKAFFSDLDSILNTLEAVALASQASLILTIGLWSRMVMRVLTLKDKYG